MIRKRYNFVRSKQKYAFVGTGQTLDEAEEDALQQAKLFDLNKSHLVEDEEEESIEEAE
jgi:hypothetical protein